MNRKLGVSVILAALAMSGARAAEEQPVTSRVVAVGLFKNGLAVVKREVKLPGPGTFLIEDAPDPVHGTWWVEGDANVETRTARGDPKKVLREEGVYSVNTRRELIWELLFKPGEERTIKYQYTVLVYH
jgi:hypothetical protein